MVCSHLSAGYMLWTFCQPIFFGGDAFRIVVTACEKTDAVRQHGVLIRGLIAEVHAQADPALGQVHRGHMEITVVEQVRRSWILRNLYGAILGDGGINQFLNSLSIVCASLLFSLIGQHLFVMRSEANLLQPFTASAPTTGIHTVITGLAFASGQQDLS